MSVVREGGQNPPPGRGTGDVELGEGAAREAPADAGDAAPHRAAHVSDPRQDRLVDAGGAEQDRAPYVSDPQLDRAAGEAEMRRQAAARPSAPRWLQAAAAWSWRLIVVGFLIYVAAHLVSALRIVVLPCVGALLVTALLQPLAARMRRIGMPSMAATWCTLLVATAVVAGAGTLVGIRVSQESASLTNQLTRTTNELKHWLITGPFHVRKSSIEQLSNNVLAWFSSHRSFVAGTVFTGGKIATEILAGLILMLFVTFFLIKDGDRIWQWITKPLSPASMRRVDRAGREAWQTLVHYVRGTVVIAAIHATVIGVTLLSLRVPLVGPLTVLVFLASFVPLLGILVAGIVTIVVTFGTKGLAAALILLGVFIIANQLEGHLLQPQIIGRMVRLHPLAIILVLAVGGVVGGIPGAVIAVPTAAAITRAWPLLRDTPAGVEAPAAAGEPVGSPSESHPAGSAPGHSADT